MLLGAHTHTHTYTKNRQAEKETDFRISDGTEETAEIHFKS